METGTRMDDRRIAFISCVNDETEYAECKNYIDRLRLPDGYEKDLIPLRGASSMAAGYNEGLSLTNAKYKVYMHQDVFIINANFIIDLLKIFQSDDRVGAFGVVGRKRIEEEVRIAAEWDTGKILHNCAGGFMDFCHEKEETVPVEAVDGLLIATQYDLKWRDDIFDGWDFYDIAQCMEYYRAGYRVVVPFQSEPWCYHDNQYSRLEKYFVYQEKFCNEYRDIRNFYSVIKADSESELEELLDELKKNIIDFMNRGGRDEVADIFRQIGNRVYFSLRELAIISEIYRLESTHKEPIVFWEDHQYAQDLLTKVRKLKYLLKQLEYGVGAPDEIMDKISSSYSVFAAAVVCNAYVGYKRRVSEQIASYYHRRNRGMEEQVWSQISTEFLECL